MNARQTTPARELKAGPRGRSSPAFLPHTKYHLRNTIAIGNTDESERNIIPKTHAKRRTAHPGDVVPD